MSETKRLVEWAISFVKYMDIVKKSIQDIKAEENKVLVKFKEKEQLFLILPELDKDKLESFSELIKDKSIIIITLNSDNNITFLAENWKELSKNPLLSFYFVNPESSTDKKWAICPHAHNKIADISSLKPGLMSIAEGVEKVS